MKKLTGIMGLLICVSLHAQTYDTNNVMVQTFVGSGFSGWVDGQGTQTMFRDPRNIVSDTQNNLFVLDSGNYRIRKITPDGTVSTFVGGGNANLPGYGTNVSLNFDFGDMTIDRSNNLWIAAENANSLIKISPDGYASKTNLTGISPGGLCVDSSNTLYISSSSHKIYRWNWTASAQPEVFAGSGNVGSADGNGIFTSFYRPRALASDVADNIYVFDSYNYLLRRIDKERNVTTIAGKQAISSDSDGIGTNASFSYVHSMCVDNSGNLFLATPKNIRKVTVATNVYTLAGSFSQSGYTNGTGSLARFNTAHGICLNDGTIFISDQQNQRIRQITFNPSEQPVSGGNLDLSTYPGLKITGTVGRTYRVESSTDMGSWGTETTLLLTRSPYLWIDQNSIGQRKFYRAFMLP